MGADAIFARCAARRRAVADLIETLDDAEPATPSLCGEWTVKRSPVGIAPADLDRT